MVFFMLLLLISTNSLALDLNKLYSSVKETFKPENNSASISEPPGNVLFIKKFEGLRPFIFGSQSNLFGSSSTQLFEINLDNLQQTNFKTNPGDDIETYQVVLGTNEGLYATKDNVVFLVSKNAPPKVIHKFNDRIQWAETTNSFAVLKSADRKLGLLSNGKVTVLSGETERNTNLRTVNDFIEVYEVDENHSRVTRYGASGAILNCEADRKIYNLALDNTGEYAIGQTLKDSVSYIVGVNCKSKKVVWEKKLHGAIMKRVQGPDNHFDTKLISHTSNCGENICINPLDSQTTIGGATESGVYCLNAKSGSVDWEFSKVVSNDVESTLNANIIAPISCYKNQLVALQNGGPVIYYQKFPVSVEAPREYLLPESQKIIQKETSSQHPTITNPSISPKWFDGKIVFTTSSSKIIVIGHK
jgi:hypothetical protein